MAHVRRWMGGGSGLFLGPGWDRARVEAFQTERLPPLIRHAYESVPHYRRSFERAGIHADDVRSLADLPRIPLTSRSDLQSLPARDVIAAGFDPRKLVLHLTSGSSGQPLTVRRTWFEERLLQAYRLRILFRLGLRLTDRRVAVVFVPTSRADRAIRGLLAGFEVLERLPTRGLTACFLATCAVRSTMPPHDSSAPDVLRT